MPVLGEVPGLRGFVLATGFSGHGFAMGPIAGRLVAELIVDGKTSLDITGFRFSRFAEGAIGRPTQRPVTARAAGYAIALDVGGHVHRRRARARGQRPALGHQDTDDARRSLDRDSSPASTRPCGWPASAPEGLRHVLHGTTTATNAILEDKGAPTGLLTTAGFRYVLEIGRHDIPRRANMFAWVKPLRPVPPERVFEIGGRVAVDGAELEPLDEAAVRAAARRLREAGVDSVAVCFLHAYANPAHERRARALLLEEHPGCAVSLSTEVLPVFREFERSMATVLNAYVQPLVGRYVGRLAERLARARASTRRCPS